MDDQDVGNGRRQCQHRKIATQIESDIARQRRVDGIVQAPGGDGVAVGWRTQCGLQRKAATGARTVFDDERLARLFSEGL